MIKKVFLLCLLSLFITVLSFQTAMAYDPNWKANQQKLFDQIPVKAGDVIDTSNWQKVKDLLPESILGYVKEGEFVLKIGEFKHDYSGDEAWEKAGEMNRGKYALGSKKEIIDKATGKFPMYIYGKPFPDLDKNDPDFGIKFMHNNAVERGRGGSANQIGPTLFVSEEGLDRYLVSRVLYTYYWGQREGEVPNPNKFKFMEIVRLLDPYDLAGTSVLTHRALDGSPDRGGTYVPALRRVRKTSGLNRSDPFFGSEFVIDDSMGWGGQNETMSWKVVGEKVMLCPKDDFHAQSPDMMTEQPNGAWKTTMAIPPLNFGYMDKNWSGAKWAPNHAVWVPREVYLIEATPLDPYYNYGKCLFYYDKVAGVPAYKIISNKAGEHWKTLIVQQLSQVWDNRKTISSVSWYVCIDDRRHHASISPWRGNWGNQEYEPFLTLGDPNVKRADFTFEKLATMSK